MRPLLTGLALAAGPVDLVWGYPHPNYAANCRLRYLALPLFCLSGGLSDLWWLTTGQKGIESHALGLC